MTTTNRNCPICDGNKGKPLFEANLQDYRQYLSERYNNLIDEEFLLNNEQYSAIRCGCGMMYQNIIPSENDLSLFYNTMIPKESLCKRSEGTNEHFFAYAREAGQISNLIKRKHKDIKVLDFGGGWGHWTNMCKAFGYDATLYDLSEERREYAKNELKVNVIDKLKGDYDFINAEQIFEHLPNPLELLNELVQHVNKGGYVYISVPDGRKLVNGFSNPNFFKAPYKAIMPFEHLNAFTHQTLVDLGKEAGLTPIRYPMMLSHRYSIKSMLKGFAKPIYQQIYGTNLYFQKC